MSLLDELEQRYLSTAKPDTQRHWKETVNKLWGHLQPKVTKALHDGGLGGLLKAAPGLVTENLADFKELGKVGHEVFASWDPRLQRRVQEEVIYYTSGHRPKSFTELPAWTSADAKNGLSELPNTASLFGVLKQLVGEPIASLLEKALGGHSLADLSPSNLPQPILHHAALPAQDAPPGAIKQVADGVVKQLWKLVNDTELKGILLSAVGLKPGELEPNIVLPTDKPKIVASKVEAVTKAPSAGDLPILPQVAKPAHAKQPMLG